MALRTAFDGSRPARPRRRGTSLDGWLAFRQRVLSVLHRLGLYTIARALYRRILLVADRLGLLGRRDPARAHATLLTPRTREVLTALKAAAGRGRKAPR